MRMIFSIFNFYISVRNRDMSWPEEMTSMALNKAIRDKRPHGLFIFNCFKLTLRDTVYVFLCC